MDYTRGPIDWPPLEFAPPSRERDAFTQMVADAYRELDAHERAADAATLAAMPVDASEVDESDDRDLIDGRAAFQAASDARGELLTVDERAELVRLGLIVDDEARAVEPEPGFEAAPDLPDPREHRPPGKDPDDPDVGRKGGG